MLKKRFLVSLLVLVLAVGVIGVANAATIWWGTANQTTDQAAAAQIQNAVQTVAQAPVAVTPDTVQQMIQACWQMNQTMIDQWVNTTGLSREELLKMEQAWMQGVMQQNPNLDTQAAFNMHQSWMQNYMNSYRPVSQQAPAQSVNQQQAPVQQYSAPAPSQNYRQYNNWNCPWGYGYGCW